MNYIKYHRIYKKTQTTMIHIYNEPQYILSHDTWLDLKEYYDTDNYEFIMIKDFFCQDKIQCQIELNTIDDDILDNLEIIGRNQWIELLERQQGYQYPGTFIWLNNISDISGTVMLPLKDYSNIYHIDSNISEIDIANCYKDSDYFYVSVESFSGIGTIQNPWEINSFIDLQNIGFADDLNNRWSIGSDNKYSNWNLNDHYIITNDIDCAGYDFKPIGYELGSLYSIFNGSLNGNFKSIDNLTINLLNHDYIGLIAYNNGDLTNLKINDTNIKGRGYVGGIAGYNNSNILNSEHQGSITGHETTGDYIGGIAGINYGSIKYCNTNINIENLRLYQGGITGGNYNLIANCYAHGSITGRWYTGGIVGLNNKAKIHNSYCCINTVGISASYNGGFAGDIVTGVGYEDINNYWNQTLSTVKTSSMGISKNDTQMKQLATYSNWNIEALNDYIHSTGRPYFAESNTLIDFTKNWTSNELINYLITIMYGVGQGETYLIISNSNNSIETNKNWLAIPDQNSYYLIYSSWIVSSADYPVLWYQIDLFNIIENESIDYTISMTELLTYVNLAEDVLINVDLQIEMTSIIYLDANIILSPAMRLVIPYIKQPTDINVIPTKTKVVVY